MLILHLKKLRKPLLSILLDSFYDFEKISEYHQKASQWIFNVRVRKEILVNIGNMSNYRMLSILYSTSKKDIARNSFILLTDNLQHSSSSLSTSLTWRGTQNWIIFYQHWVLKPVYFKCILCILSSNFNINQTWLVYKMVKAMKFSFLIYFHFSRRHP